VRCTGRNTLEGQDRRHEIDVTYRDTDLDATLEIDAPGEAGVMDGPPHVQGAWARSTFLCAVGDCIPGVGEAERITNHQVIVVHAIHLTNLCVSQA
jgi:hypothetical protein